MTHAWSDDYHRGDLVKVKGRRGVHTVGTAFAKGRGWWVVVPDGGKFIPARPEDMRRA